jgi:hypothetical protein
MRYAPMKQHANSLVCESHRFVLWWHAKSACTTLKAWYLDLFSYTITDVPELGVFANGMSVHNRIGGWNNQYDPKRHEGYFHFTVVRHPLARFVSHWDQQVAAQNAGDLLSYARETVVTPQEVCDPHLSRQHRHLWGLPMHHVLRIEELDEGWVPLMQLLGLPEQPLPLRNVRGVGARWEEILGEGIVRDILTRHYAEDLTTYYEDWEP